MFKIRKIKLLALGIEVVALFLVWSAYFSFLPTDKLRVTFFDVGQGDAALIQTPDHKQILIDGGPDNSILAKVGQALPFFDRTIEVLLVTHPDSDHLAGAVEIAKNYNIGLVILNGTDCVTKICEEFNRVIKQKNIKVVIADSGQKILFGRGAEMDILLPRKEAAGAVKKEDNNLSIISRLAYGKDSFLFTGDAEAREEINLINLWPNLTAEVLKVAHHGSKNSSTQSLLDKLKPKFSVISVGAKNRYGHPTLETLDRLKKISSEILRTDLAGDIRIESNGNGAVIAN